MSYTPTEWKTGDVVTSAKLNKLEQGVADAGGVVIVTGTINEDTVTLGKTYSEIKADYMAGYTVVILFETERGEDATETDWNQVTGFNEYTGTDPQSDPAAYTVVAFDARFTATDPNGYPKQ